MPLWPIALMWCSLACLPFALRAWYLARKELQQSEYAKGLEGLKVIDNEGARVYPFRRVG